MPYGRCNCIEWAVISALQWFCSFMVLLSVSPCLCLSRSLSESFSPCLCFSLSLSLSHSLSLSLFVSVSTSLCLFPCVCLSMSLPLSLCLSLPVSVSPVSPLHVQFHLNTLHFMSQFTDHGLSLVGGASPSSQICPPRPVRPHPPPIPLTTPVHSCYVTDREQSVTMSRRPSTDTQTHSAPTNRWTQ